jgi:hypothetical protein
MHMLECKIRPLAFYQRKKAKTQGVVAVKAVAHKMKGEGVRFRISHPAQETVLSYLSFWRAGVSNEVERRARVPF